MLEVCRFFLDEAGSEQTLSEAQRRHISAKLEAFSQQGLRVLRIAYKQTPKEII